MFKELQEKYRQWLQLTFSTFIFPLFPIVWTLIVSVQQTNNYLVVVIRPPQFHHPLSPTPPCHQIEHHPPMSHQKPLTLSPFSCPPSRMFNYPWLHSFKLSPLQLFSRPSSKSFSCPPPKLFSCPLPKLFHHPLQKSFNLFLPQRWFNCPLPQLSSPQPPLLQQCRVLSKLILVPMTLPLLP